MLNKNEAFRLANILACVRMDRNKNVKYAEEYTIETVEFLATRLRELDVEYKQLIKRHGELDEMLAEKMVRVDELQLKLDQSEGRA